MGSFLKKKLFLYATFLSYFTPAANDQHRVLVSLFSSLFTERSAALCVAPAPGPLQIREDGTSSDRVVRSRGCNLLFIYV